MKLQVFISWSGERSRLVAESMVDWLPRVLQASDPWMSKQIQKGDRWSQRIGEKLADYHVGVICVTPENVAAPWLLFEAGALSKALGNAKVCPALLGLNPSELGGPLGQFQATVVEKRDLFELLRTLNAQLEGEAVDPSVLAAAFTREWPRFERKLKRIASAPMEPTAVSVPSVIRSFAKHGFPDPDVGSAAHFTAGFESHGLYSTACDLAKKQLVVFGRKNRKLFDKEHSDFFAGVKAKVEAGLDFRCLVLDPEAPPHVIAAAHQDDDFVSELRRCIERACLIMRNSGLDPGRHFRLYRVQRSASTLFIDDAVLYARIKMTPDGRACALTKCPFAVVASGSPIGEELVDDFETVWSGARQLPATP